MRKLIYYDVDETLFVHDEEHAPAILLKDSSGIKRIPTTEYNSIAKLNTGQQFDFSEFRCAKRFTMSARPVKKMINRMLTDHFCGENVSMLTARGDMDDQVLIKNFFKENHIDIDHIHLHRAGNHGHDSPSKNKYIHISEALRSCPDIKHITMYDDNQKMHGVMKTISIEFKIETVFHHVIPPHSDGLFETYKFFYGENYE